MQRRPPNTKVKYNQDPRNLRAQQTNKLQQSAAAARTNTGRRLREPSSPEPREHHRRLQALRIEEEARRERRCHCPCSASTRGIPVHHLGSRSGSSVRRLRRRNTIPTLLGPPTPRQATNPPRDAKPSTSSCTRLHQLLNGSGASIVAAGMESEDKIHAMATATASPTTAGNHKTSASSPPPRRAASRWEETRPLYSPMHRRRPHTSSATRHTHTPTMYTPRSRHRGSPPTRRRHGRRRGRRPTGSPAIDRGNELAFLPPQRTVARERSERDMRYADIFGKPAMT